MFGATPTLAGNADLAGDPLSDVAGVPLSNRPAVGRGSRVGVALAVVPIVDPIPARAVGHVEIRLVDAHLADHVGALLQYLLHVAGDILVEIEIDGPVVACVVVAVGLVAVGSFGVAID
jgi:hypothetical protein